MNNLTNIIEGIVFASGEAIPTKFIAEKLGCSVKEIKQAIEELAKKYSGECGIQLLTFNGKIQFATNPDYRQQISDVITPIREKELTKTILECAALIAYKQPVTRGEIEELRGVNCDYAIHSLLELGMIEPCGRKDVVGKPILYATTDMFLKRFKLKAIDELPDYDSLMAQIAEINNNILREEEQEKYLYQKDEYVEENEEGGESSEAPQDSAQEPSSDDGMDVPDFLDGEDGVVKID